MDRNILIKEISQKEKLVRTEYGLNQDEMAKVLGISRKSLVETEKGRRLFAWPECIALVALFPQSQVLRSFLGENLADELRTAAFEDMEIAYPQTMGGKVWWRDIENHQGYRIQQNILSSHYRLLNPRDERMASSFNIDEIREALASIRK